MATATKAATQAPATTGRYSSLIARMTTALGHVRDERLRASDALVIELLDGKIDNLERAIDLFTRAEEVAPERRQFGSPNARSLRVKLPPNVEGFSFPPIRFQRYVYVTEEPVELLLLREMIAEGRIEGLEEMEPGLIAAVPKTGHFIGFYPEAYVMDLGRAGVLKSQIG